MASYTCNVFSFSESEIDIGSFSRNEIVIGESLFYGIKQGWSVDWIYQTPP